VIYELFPNYAPPFPFASKSGGHDPPSSYGSAAPAFHIKTSVSETIRKPPLVKAQTVLETKKNKKYGVKQFSIWRMDFLHPAMWHDDDIDFAT